MVTTITKRLDGLTVEVKIDRRVTDKTSYADGYNINLGKETYELTTIKIEKNGKGAFCRDLNFFYVVNDRFDKTRDRMPNAYARLGDTYISEPVYNVISEALAEAEAAAGVATDSEFRSVKTDEDDKKAKNEANAAKIAEIELKRSEHPGWCDKCHSYCYGDCEAN